MFTFWEVDQSLQIKRISCNHFETLLDQSCGEFSSIEESGLFRVNSFGLPLSC